MRRHVDFVTYSLVISLLALGAMASCTTSPSDPSAEPDSGSDGVDDTDVESDAELDAGDADDDPDAESDTDADGGPPTNLEWEPASQPVDPPRTIESGDDGFLLRGTVLTPDGATDHREVLVDGELIVCVDDDCSSEAAEGDFAVIETDGVISPGLVDAHNHLPYNFLPPWVPSPDIYFNNRYEWADDAAYRDHIAPYADNRMSGSHYCPAAKWGELRSLVHATTTIQGQSFQQRCVDWAVRNADHYHDLKHNHMRTSIASPLDFTDDQADNYIDSFEDEDNPVTRFAVHMAEGHSGQVEDEFASFAGRDDRDNRHAGVSLLEHGTALLIHSMTLSHAELDEVFLYDGHIVWSPSSNFHLYGYGQTAPIETILDYDINTALGPDWTISGAFDMLQEMRVAKQYGIIEDIDALTAHRIWQMATHDGAKAVGLHDYIGRLEPGYRADISVFGRNGDDPHRALVDSHSEDIELVLIDGNAYFGDAALKPKGRNDHCQAFDACGAPKFICPKDGPDADDRGDERLEDIEQQLVDILEGTDDAPEDEQYGRGDELLDLVICGMNAPSFH